MQVWLASRAGPSRPRLSQCSVLYVLLSDMHVSMYVLQSRESDAKWGVAQKNSGKLDERHRNTLAHALHWLN